MHLEIKYRIQLAESKYKRRRCEGRRHKPKATKQRKQTMVTGPICGLVEALCATDAARKCCHCGSARWASIARW